MGIAAAQTPGGGGGGGSGGNVTVIAPTGSTPTASAVGVAMAPDQVAIPTNSTIVAPIGPDTAANSVPVTFATDQTAIPVKQPDVSATGQTINSSSTSNGYAITLGNGVQSVSFHVTGLTASGATLTIQASADGGTTWTLPVVGFKPGTTAPAGFTMLTADQDFYVNTASATNVRLQVTATGTGTITVASVASVGIAGVTQISPVLATPNPATSGGTSVFSEIVAANTTSVAVKASAGQIYGIRVFSNNTTQVYGKLYNAAQGSTTCGSGTPQDRFSIPAATGGSGFVVPIPMGEQFSTAITLCVTGGIADNDTTTPAATSYLVSIDYK
jgi:hypothetical protein